MDKEGFRQFLETRKLTEDQMKQHFEMVERFEAFLSNFNPSTTLERCGAEETRGFVDKLVMDGECSYVNLLPVARYSYYKKNFPVYLAIVELLDGYEAFEGMYKKVGQVLGEQKREEIFNNIDLPSLGVANWQKAQLTRTVMQRLEECVDEQAYREIFSDSFRDLPDSSYLNDKIRYEEIGDFDKFLEWKRQEFIHELETIKAEGRLFFNQEITEEVLDLVRMNPEIAEGVRQGNTLYVTKIPYMAKEYLAETDPNKKRYFYCHCPWARESLRQEEGPVSVKFCKCSAGYHKKPWEVILDQKLEAEVVESVLQGDLRCRFAIFLPDTILK